MLQASVCNAVVRLKLEMYALPKGTRSAVVVDNYNALYWNANFGEVQGLNVLPADRVTGHRETYSRPVTAQELTLAANLRVLGDTNNKHTVCIVAGSTSEQVQALCQDAASDDIFLVQPESLCMAVTSTVGYQQRVQYKLFLVLRNNANILFMIMPVDVYSGVASLLE